MPIVIAAPPQPVAIFSGFDYVTVDPLHHRVYAAHPASKRLLVVDSTTGNVLAQVDVGPMHGVAVDPASGAIFTGDGTDRALSKVDPATLQVVGNVDLPGNVDAIAYDASRHRVYADQAGGGSVYVIDGSTMKLIGTIAMPAGDLESPAVDPKTGILYQNLANGGGFAIVDPASLKVVKVVKTPQLNDNHPLVFAVAANQVIVGGENGVISAYTPDGVHVGDAQVQPHIDQCSTGSRGSVVVCAGRGIVSVLAVASGSAPRVVARLDTGHRELHTVGIDEATHDLWIVYPEKSGDWVQRLRWAPSSD
jgi:DNA-binding beta-propeller fold protein YncE